MAIEPDRLTSLASPAVAADRIISAAPVSKQEEAFERALRPKMLDEYIGQEKVREKLSIFIEASRKRKYKMGNSSLRSGDNKITVVAFAA